MITTLISEVSKNNAQERANKHHEKLETLIYQLLQSLQ